MGGRGQPFGRYVKEVTITQAMADKFKDHHRWPPKCFTCDKDLGVGDTLKGNWPIARGGWHIACKEDQ